MREGKQQRESIESLRSILEGQSSRPIHLDEAQEIGESLLDFYELLARRE